MSVRPHFSRMIGLGLLLLAPAVFAAPLHLDARLPATFEDATHPVARVTLTNASGAPMTILAPDATTVRFRISKRQDFGTGKWVVHLDRDLLAPKHALVTLAPNQSISAEIHVLDEYPFGLAPGEYDIAAAYTVWPDVQNVSWHGEVDSPPARATVAMPRTEVYAAFLEASASVTAHKADAPGRVLAFARKHPAFPYAAPMLVALLHSADADTAAQIIDFVETTWPGSEYARQASSIHAAAVQQRNEQTAYEKYIERLREYASAHPEEARAAQRALGTIAAPEHFTRTDEFIRKYPTSPLAAKALWFEIDAVQHGVLPPGATVRNRDHVLAAFYRQLLQQHPESYWARRAAEDRAVKKLLENDR